jgi:SAM-dependent methyltransferase
VTSVDYADTYDPDTDFDRYYTIATARKIAERIGPDDRVLELGCATGLMASVVMDYATPRSWTGVDRSPAFLARAQGRNLPATTFRLGDLDALDQVDGPNDSYGSDSYDKASYEHAGYEHVLATNVLHELANPERFLRACATRLAPGGVIHVTLQNPNSIHRVCALAMGLIGSLDEISERGSQWGTRGLWTADELQELAARAGLSTRQRSGIMLKPLPNHLMSQLSDDVIEGFIRGAAELPDSGAMNYLVLGRD